jgi:hypothetical protein
MFRGISGKMGDIVFRTSKTGKTHIAKLPRKSKDKPSEAQRAQRQRFIMAGEYAKHAQANAVYVELAAQTDRSAYQIAFSDWFNPPVIDSVERRSGHIDIFASDDVQVTKVYVTISNEDGVTLEQGQAAPVNRAWWKYETEVAGNVQIEVLDLAGNITRHGA